MVVKYPKYVTKSRVDSLARALGVGTQAEAWLYIAWAMQNRIAVPSLFDGGADAWELSENGACGEWVPVDDSYLVYDELVDAKTDWGEDMRLPSSAFWEDSHSISPESYVILEQTLTGKMDGAEDLHELIRCEELLIELQSTIEEPSPALPRHSLREERPRNNPAPSFEMTGSRSAMRAPGENIGRKGSIELWNADARVELPEGGGGVVDAEKALNKALKMLADGTPLPVSLTESC
jgi:hypothetical protein